MSVLNMINAIDFLMIIIYSMRVLTLSLSIRMNKISFSPIVILFTLCILVGCARSTDTNTSTSTSKGASTSTSTGMPIQKPISTGSQSLPNPTKVSTDGTKIPTQQEKIF